MYAITATTLLSLATLSLANGGPPPPPPGYQAPPPPAGYQPPPPPQGEYKPPKTKITTSPSPTSTCDQFICVDYINDCGQWYGGCYNDCPGVPKPTFTDPGCPTTTSEPVFSILPFPPFTTTTSEPIFSILPFPPFTTTTSEEPIFSILPFPPFTTTTSEPVFSILPYPPFTTTTSEPIFSILPFPPFPTTTSTCTQTICADYVNECGQWYGGCYAACPDSPTPTFVPPPCSTAATTTIEPTGKPTGKPTKYNPTGKPTTYKPTSVKPSSSSSTTCTVTLCADYINECGQLYGGCYAACPGLPTPTFTPPPCTQPTVVPPTTTTNTCTQTICVDKVNSCGLKYGGCYANCPDSPLPTFTTPPCPTTTSAKPTKKPTSSVCSQTICVDKVNSCGLKYGGCYANCPDSPTPTFSPPPCPTSTISTVTTTGKPKGYYA